MARGSAAWVVAILAVTMGIVGSLLLTVVDPVQQQLFASGLWSSSTTYGTDALRWQRDAWMVWPAFILFGIMIEVWVHTRRAS